MHRGGEIKANEYGIKERQLDLRCWIRVYRATWRVMGIPTLHSDPSSNEKSIAQDVDENAASSSQVRHQNEQRSSIEKLIAKVSNRLAETRLT